MAIAISALRLAALLPGSSECRQTAVGIRDDIALFNSDIQGERAGRGARSAHNEKTDGREETARVQCAQRKRTTSGSGMYLPFRLSQVELSII